jgi:hypothetical protein
MRYLPFLILALLAACGQKESAPHSTSAPEESTPAAKQAIEERTVDKAIESKKPLNLALPEDIEAARSQGTLPQQTDALPQLFKQEENTGTTLKARPKLQFEEGETAPQLDGAEVEITIPLN